MQGVWKIGKGMSIYCIGDLHLSGWPQAKPMEVFGPQWLGHTHKVKENWLATVQPEDVVLVCGDISWAMSLEGAAPDLQWLARLPGRKILLRGNHDYWWSGPTKLRSRYPEFEFLQNDAILLGSLAVCGSRGWKVPSNEEFSPEDQKIYARELLRLELSFKSALQQGAKDILCVLHFPPFFKEDEENGFTELFRNYPVRQVVFGHIHGEKHVSVFQGEREGVGYRLCSCDICDFQPVKIV